MPELPLQETLARRVILEPLFGYILAEPNREYDVIVTVNEDYRGGRSAAREAVYRLLDRKPPEHAGYSPTHSYVFARLAGEQVLDLVRRDADAQVKQSRADGLGLTHAVEDDPRLHAVYKISEDHEVQCCVTRTLTTIKADAAHRAFRALGEGICWAVLDTGIDRNHPHLTANLDVALPLEHMDFTDPPGNALEDLNGHGTHVAGIIAGQSEDPEALMIREILVDSPEKTRLVASKVGTVSGVAPKAMLVCLKVLSENGKGKVSSVLNAIDKIQQINDFGRRLMIHGANLSLGYEFEPEWFAAGQSPLCVEVDRLVRSGVVVVVAAGNTGYGKRLDDSGRAVKGFYMVSINDPGNADLAITVGSTHRDMPHLYGVSYFSSKGPTADGRMKPDLVAPGERIVSCLAGSKRASLQKRSGMEGAAAGKLLYGEDSGTSMSAPHVSGAIAAFLSVHGEFIGRPAQVKEIFLNSATDLKRDRYLQGHGLVDLMRALQSV